MKFCRGCIVQKASQETSEQILQEKILNLRASEDQDQETSLELAAEAGNLITYENSTLKETFDLNHVIFKSETEDKLKPIKKGNLTQLINNLKNEHNKEISHLLRTLEEKEQAIGILEAQIKLEAKIN